jgi:hypothetical protein
MPSTHLRAVPSVLFYPSAVELRAGVSILAVRPTVRSNHLLATAHSVPRFTEDERHSARRSNAAAKMVCRWVRVQH